MPKLVVVALSVAAYISAGLVQADTATYLYSEVSARGGSSASVSVTSSVQSGSTSIITVNGQQVMPTDVSGTDLIPTPRIPLTQLVEPQKAPLPSGRARSQNEKRETRFTQFVQSGTTATGSIRVYRETNGQVVEDNLITLPFARATQVQNQENNSTQGPFSTGRIAPSVGSTSKIFTEAMKIKSFRHFIDTIVALFQRESY